MLFITIFIPCFCGYMLYLVFFWQWGKGSQPFYNKEGALIIGHRGAPAILTENTLLSFQKAIDQGVDGIELDVRLSKDKQIIVFHDKNLKRLSNRDDKIKDLSLSELQNVVLTRAEGQEKKTHIPSLSEVIPLLDGIRVLNIEIKTDSLFEGHEIIGPLIQFLNKHQIDDKCIVSSFNPLILKNLRIKRPQTNIGFLYNRNHLFHGWNNLVWILRVQPESLHIHHSLLDHWIVKWARKKGLRINSYTINEKEIYEKEKHKIDGVFTDNIEYLK